MERVGMFDTSELGYLDQLIVELNAVKSDLAKQVKSLESADGNINFDNYRIPAQYGRNKIVPDFARKLDRLTDKSIMEVQLTSYDQHLIGIIEAAKSSVDLPVEEGAAKVREACEYTIQSVDGVIGAAKFTKREYFYNTLKSMFDRMKEYLHHLMPHDSFAQTQALPSQYPYQFDKIPPTFTTEQGDRVFINGPINPSMIKNINACRVEIKEFLLKEADAVPGEPVLKGCPALENKLAVLDKYRSINPSDVTPSTMVKLYNDMKNVRRFLSSASFHSSFDERRRLAEHLTKIDKYPTFYR